MGLVYSQATDVVIAEETAQFSATQLELAAGELRDPVQKSVCPCPSPSLELGEEQQGSVV